MSKPAAAPALTRESSTNKLAKFFPNATPVRIPVRLTRLGDASSTSSESTVIEFGTPQEVLFASSLPLEFDDKVRIERERNGGTADAKVIAVQYHEGRKAVAVRFLQGPCAWVTQP